jgi:hypothetical protein
MGSQFSGHFSYTWSHALDTCSNDCTPAIFNGLSAISIRFQFNPLSLRSLNYSNADYDVRHSVNGVYAYTLPAQYFHGPFLKGVLGGWTASGTFFYHSSYPFSILDPGVISQFGNLSGKITQPFIADFLSGSSYPSCTTPNVSCYSRSLFATKANQHDFGNIPRNSFRGPGYFDTDFHLDKAFSLAEKYRFIIGASFFNILNHPNFDLPVNSVPSSVFGQILSTVSAPTSAYGAFAGSTVSGRVIQTMAKFSF